MTEAKDLPRDGELVCIGNSEINEAKRLREVMAKQDVAVELRSNPATCSTGGCTITVEVWVHAAGVEALKAHLHAERAKVLAGLDVNHEQHGAVYDPTQTAVQCPACGEKFSPVNKECPECGLVFMAE